MTTRNAPSGEYNVTIEFPGRNGRRFSRRMFHTEDQAGGFLAHAMARAERHHAKCTAALYRGSDLIFSASL